MDNLAKGGGFSLNESPSEKEGKFKIRRAGAFKGSPSMKVPPKRKGNLPEPFPAPSSPALNESPSEKEGKSGMDERSEIALISQ